MICYATIGALYVLGYVVSVAAVNYSFKISDGHYAPPLLAVVVGWFWPLMTVAVLLFMLLTWLYKTEEVRT